MFWLSTVRPDGRPHVTPLLAVWLDASLYFCTSPPERKAKNLDHNPRCILTTGRNRLDGLDIVVEGEAREVSDELEAAPPTHMQQVPEDFAEPDGDWFDSTTPSAPGTRCCTESRQRQPSRSKGASFSQTRYTPAAAAS